MAKFEEFASLDWLENLISFGFRLIAKLSEPFLAFGLIASAIDYGTHGAFLARQPGIMALWIVLQAVALEGSGGVALSMSLEARESGDLFKARLQGALALLLMATGGVMFFSEQARTAPGWEQVLSSPPYIYGMGALRTLVSLGYIAVMRTRRHRFSAKAGDVQPITVPPEQVQTQIQEIAQQLEQRLAQRIERQLEQMRSLSITLNQVQNQVQGPSAHPEPEPHQLRTVIEPEPAQTTEPLAVAALPEPDPEPANGNGDDQKKRAVQRYIISQRARGREPTLAEIMAACGCAKNTAIKYRRLFSEEEGK